MKLNEVKQPSIIKHATKDFKNRKEKLLVKYIISFITFVLMFVLFLWFNNKGKGIYSEKLNFVLLIILLVFIVFSSLVLMSLFIKKDFKLIKIIYETLDLIHFLMLVVTIIFFVQLYVFTITEVEGSSMEPTLHQTDRVIVTQLFLNYELDDVVVIRAKKYIGSANEEYYVKRIKAVPGDEISYEENNDVSALSVTIYINSVKSFIVPVSSIDNWKNWINEINGIIPKDKFLLLGDNINESYDSKTFGLVDKKDILGTVRFRFFKEIGAIK